MPEGGHTEVSSLDEPAVPSDRPKYHRTRVTDSAKSRRLHIILSFLFFLMFAGTAAAAVLAYNSSTVELKLVGEKSLNLTEENREFDEPGFYARHCVFARCHDLTKEVVVENPDIEKIKSHTIGEYAISYTLNYLGETYADSREIKIEDVDAPTITLNGPEVVGLYVGENFDDPGATANDAHDGDLTANVAIDGAVDTSQFGVYTLKYSVEDAAGNSAETSRRVFVYNYAAFTSEPISTFDELRDYIIRNGWDISFGFRNLDNDYTYSYRGDDLYYGASLVKTVDAMYVYERFGGPRTQNERYLVTQAITYSNNSAHTSLVSSLGFSNLQEYASSFGMTHHLRGSTIYGDTAYFCDTSVNDQLAEWYHLWYLINNLGSGEDLKHYFINNYWDNLSFPGSPTHMYKNGLYGNNYHESGIMFAESPFIMTFLSTEGWRWNMTYIMQDLAERVYLINQSL